MTPGRIAALLLAVTALGACTANVPEPDTPGARLYVRRCGGCHRLYRPATMTFEMWKMQVGRMQGEMARRGVPPLDRAETEILLDYLRRNAG